MLTEANEYETVCDASSNEFRRAAKGLSVTAAYMVAAGGPEIESLAARFTTETRETASIRSSADTQTRWLLSRPMARDLNKNGIDFRKLKDEPTTVYVVLPAERLRTHAVWLRLVIVTALRALSRPGGRRTVMLIDEMAALGHLPPLEDAFGIVRGFRIQIAAIFQDLAQLKALYKERWETFVANAGVVFGFGPNDLTTAEWMSKRAGQTTVTVKSVSKSSGESTGAQFSMNSGTSSADNQAARPLFLPDELFGLEEGSGLLWLQALRYPVRFFAPGYWKVREWRDRAEPNPYAPIES
jgi:type IV secretion system protein VirD4